MGKVRFPSLPPPLWESKAFRSLREMWNVMIPTSDFFWSLFFLLWAPCHCCSGGESPSPHCLHYKGTQMRSPHFLPPFGKVRQEKGFGLDVAGVDVQVSTTHGAFLGDMVWLIRYSVSAATQSWSVGFFHCPISHLHLSVGSPHILYSGEWEVPAAFCTATLSFLSTSDVSLRVHLTPQRRLLNR